MAIGPIQNGESGLSVRQKLNALIGAVNEGASTEYIDGKIGELQDWIDANIGKVAEEAAAEAERLAQELTAEQEARVAEAIRAAADARAMRDTIRELAAQAAEQGYEDFKARKEIRDQLNAEIGRYSAHFDQRIIVAADDLVSVAQRVTELSTKSDALNSKILLVETSLTDQTSALAQTIASLAVGTNTQFDYTDIWYFDTTTEGWTGYPLAPTVTAGGWLRPANNAEYVQSPAIQVDGDKYQQVRARVRRVGSPVWKGEFWWTGNLTPDHVEPEPGWGDDLASITVDMPWSGNIASLRMNLATNTSTDYVEIDWVAIGRPTPGASSAEVQALRRAYIDGDEALAERIDTVYADMTTKEGGQAIADAVDALTTRVSETEDGLEVVGQDIQSIRVELGDKAESEAVDQLLSRIDKLDDGSTVTQAQNNRVLRSAMRGLALEALQGAHRAFLDTRGTVDALAEASNSLGSRIDATDTSLSLVAQDVTLLKLEIPGLAKVTALDALRSRVTLTEQGIVAAAERITSLEVALPQRATVTALNALTTRVSDTEDGLTAVATDVAQLKVEVPQKATVTALNALVTRVTNAEGSLSTLATDVSSLKIELPKRATVTALNALTVRVEDTEGDISSMADSLLALQTNVGRYSASGRFRVTVEATPAGALSRIGLKAATSGTDGDRSAALFLEAISGGLSRAIVVADHFAVVAGATSTRVYPFYVTDGVVYIDTAHIRALTVDTIHIRGNAISNDEWSFTAGDFSVTNSGLNDNNIVQTLSYTIARRGPQRLDVHCIISGGGPHMIRLQRVHNGSGEWVRSEPIRANFGGEISWRVIDPVSLSGSVTYRLFVYKLDGYQGPITVSRRFIGALNVAK